MIQGCLKCNTIFDEIFDTCCPNCYSDRVVDMHHMLKNLSSREDFEEGLEELNFNEDDI